MGCVCSLFTILAILIVILGFLLFAGGTLVFLGWIVAMIIAVLTTGPGGAGALALATWWIPVVAIVMSLFGFFVMMLGYLVVMATTAICSPRQGASGLMSASAGQSPFQWLGLSLPPLPFGSFPFPGLIPPPPLDPLGLLALTLLPAEQLGRLSPELFRLVTCLKNCLCDCDSNGDIPTPPEVVKDLLAHLRKQLEDARDNLAKAKTPDAIKTWTERIAQLTNEITKLGG